MELRHDLRVHCNVEDLISTATFCFCAIHCGVGVSKQLLGPRAARAHHRDTDAQRRKYLLAFNHEWRIQSLEQTLGQPRGIPDVGYGVEKDGKLIPAEPRDAVDLAHGFSETARQG